MSVAVKILTSRKFYFSLHIVHGQLHWSWSRARRVRALTSEKHPIFKRKVALNAPTSTWSLFHCTTIAAAVSVENILPFQIAVSRTAAVKWFLDWFRRLNSWARKDCNSYLIG